MNSFVNEYRTLGLTGTSMPEQAIAELEGVLGVSLPDCYRAYLAIAGNGPPPSLIGSDCHSGYLPQLHDWAVDLLNENDNPFSLPKNAIVFLMHQGYQFFYFISDGQSNDPPVRYYFEGNDSDTCEYDRFSDWVRVVACDG